MKNSCLLPCMKISLILLTLYTNTKGFALVPTSVSNCMVTVTPTATQNSKESEYPSCTSAFISSGEVSVNCISPGVLQIQGDYKEFYINCTASYPLDFRFDGHTPTEAIQTYAYATVKRNSGREITSYHMNIKVFSIPSLREYYTSMYPNKVFHHQDAYNYSRTGNYRFSGFHGRSTQKSEIYIFFEETWAVRSFIKNDRVKINLPTDEHLPFVVPCRPSHLNANVTIEQRHILAFNYNATVGFTSNYSWKDFKMNNPSAITCALGDEENTKKVVEYFTLQLQPSEAKYGYDGLGVETKIILANVERNGNRTVLARVHCQNYENHLLSGPVTVSVQDIKNPLEYQLRRHCVFPMFNNRSYATAVLNTTWLNGASFGDLTTKAYVFNAMCSDSTQFEVLTYGVGLIGRLTPFKMGEDISQTNRAENYVTENYFAISHDQPNNELYESQVVMFKCKIFSYILVPPAIWYTVRKNGSIIEESIVYEWEDNNSVAHGEIKMSKDIKEITCAARLWHLPFWKNLTRNVAVIDPVKPTFDLKQNPVQQFHERSANQVLKCTAGGKPFPDMWWQRNGQNISSSTTTTKEERTILVNFSVVSKEDEGEYICFASNVGKLEKRAFTVEVTVTDNTQNSLIIGFSVTICICVALAIRLVVYFRKYRKNESGLTESEINDFFNGEGGTAETKLTDTDEYAHEVSNLLPYNTEYEVSSRRFSIDTTKVLGSGAYGMVVMGKLDGIPVAVKTVKGNSDKSYLKALLSELKVMIFLGVHENIVNILGANTQDLSKGLAYIFVPFCSLGSMEKYLRQNRNRFMSSRSDYTNLTVGQSKRLSSEEGLENNSKTIITETDLYDWSAQIAEGMAYLSTKKVIHGDVAARNILLTGDRIAKITDFGLSRRLYDYAEYAKTQQEPLPWRWMGLESLRDLTFSTKPDVWSYGITLWEIFSLAQVPYPGYSWTMEFVMDLENGLRMAKPQFASNDLYNNLMLECWQNDPQMRPTFEQILEFLKTPLKN